MKEKYRIDTEENKLFADEIRNHLLKFGHQFPSPGGSSWYLGDDGTPWKEKNRDTYVTCRMAHVYSMGVFMGHEGSTELADEALKGLNGELKDKENGGWYAGLTSDGKALPDKLCYVHAFVILAATSTLLAKRPGAEKLLEEALSVFDKYFWDENQGLTVDTWNTEFTRLDDYRGLNANMHTVEAFLAVADAAGLEQYRDRAGRIIQRVIGWAKENNWRIPEHYTKDWVPELELNKEKPDDPFKPYGATPGHGLEWSRLITQWAMSFAAGKEEGWAAPYIEAAENLFDRAVGDAWDADGAPGIVYTTDWDGKPCVHDRMHWTLAEAINTSAVLFRVTGKNKYADYYAQFMEYLDEKVLDHVNGSWFHQLDRNNQVMDTVWPGKPDIYHALQSVLIPYERVDKSIALAVRDEYKAKKKLGFGLMRLPLLDAQDAGSIDIEQTKKMVDTFLERGFTYFDTAWMYCAFQSENAVKDVLISRHPRESYTLATKLHAGFIKTEEDRDKVFYEQMKKTGAEYFDYYLLHDVREEHYKIYTELDCFSWLAEKKAQGLVKHMGFSFHDSAEFLDKVLTEHPEMEFVQLQINYLDWESAEVQSKKCYEVAVKHNKPVIVMEPVKGGTLVNVPEETRNAFLAYHPDMSVPSWAIRFAASLPNVKVVLSGMSNMEQLLDNTEYMADFIPLNEEEQEIIKNAVEDIHKSIAIPCTGCSYCTDGCPQKIAIPKYFSLYNAAKKETNEKEWKAQIENYKKLGETFGKAKECIGCGQCEAVCPQNLPVISHLKDVSKYFDE